MYAKVLTLTWRLLWCLFVWRTWRRARHLCFKGSAEEKQIPRSPLLATAALHTCGEIAKNTGLKKGGSTRGWRQQQWATAEKMRMSRPAQFLNFPSPGQAVALIMHYQRQQKLSVGPRAFAVLWAPPTPCKRAHQRQIWWAFLKGWPT